ncbi:MAG: hypothetical protein U9N59_03960 [Campylobacterota bacterium]|nr:hypothetical protein [Campylobacterota bacterium]
MQVNNNNLNAMMQLEERLEKNAKALSKLNLNNEEASDKKQKDIKQELNSKNIEQINEPDIVKEMVKQIEIPIAYTANAEVISVQNSIHETLLDIKV